MALYAFVRLRDAETVPVPSLATLLPAGASKIELLEAWFSVSAMAAVLRRNVCGGLKLLTFPCRSYQPGFPSTYLRGAKFALQKQTSTTAVGLSQARGRQQINTGAQTEAGAPQAPTGPTTSKGVSASVANDKAPRILASEPLCCDWPDGLLSHDRADTTFRALSGTKFESEGCGCLWLRHPSFGLDGHHAVPCTPRPPSYPARPTSSASQWHGASILRIMSTAAISPRARSSYLAIYSFCRAFGTAASRRSSGEFHRSDFTGQGYSGIYEAGQPTGGPLGEASSIGAPRVTPRVLKQHLDQFVVGQERAKKILSVAVYNHYQRIQELQRRDEEEQELRNQQARREMYAHYSRHPVEGISPNDPLFAVWWKAISAAIDAQFPIKSPLPDEYPGQKPTVNVFPPDSPYQQEEQHQQTLLDAGTSPIVDTSPLAIEKSNVLLLGPSGVGKTLLAKTLARVLEVPFSISDCTPFTQSGYIGEDADVCVQRLLAAANYDVTRAERGIICLDEIDKIASAKLSHGKDVGGEGVQQALLKIIEGTTLQVQVKQATSSPSSSGGRGNPTNSPLGGGGATNSGSQGGGGGGGGKGEIYNIRTDNILFICAGAFNGLHKMVLDRVSKGSIGFGAPVRSKFKDSDGTTLKGEDKLFKKHLPFFSGSEPSEEGESRGYNTLDLVEPSDLQRFGLIPELIGRIPISCALSALDEESLVRVLTEPRHSLLKQYEQLFSLSSIELRFTSGALREVARIASGMSTGARGLRTVMERLLGESMFETPGSSVKHILITEEVAKKKAAPIYLSRGQQSKFHSMIAREEEEWEKRKSEKEAKKKGSGEDGAERRRGPQSFQEYRDRAKLADSD